jgi:predicted protein tyrosine phosphatase
MNVLFLCSANRDRSPTAEQVFRDVPGWVVKSAGTESYAEIQMTEELLDWADRIFVMEGRHWDAILKMDPSCSEKTTVLGIEDEYSRNSAKLVAKLIAKMENIVDLDEWTATKFKLDTMEGKLQKEVEPKKKYYTEEYPSGPWSRYLYQVSTGKPFKEEEFKKAFEESQKTTNHSD